MKKSMKKSMFILVICLVNFFSFFVNADTTESKYKTFGVGTGLIIPTTNGNAHSLAEVNLLGFQGHYYGFVGGNVLLSPRINMFNSHFRLRLLGLGAMFYHGDLLTVNQIPRKIDVNFASGFDIRFYKGLELRASANWFLPNPYDMVKWAQNKEESKAISITGNETEEESKEKALDISSNVNNVINDVKYVYLDALRQPYIKVSLVWEF